MATSLMPSFLRNLRAAPLFSSFWTRILAFWLIPTNFLELITSKSAHNITPSAKSVSRLSILSILSFKWLLHHFVKVCGDKHKKMNTNHHHQKWCSEENYKREKHTRFWMSTHLESTVSPHCSTTVPCCSLMVSQNNKLLFSFCFPFTSTCREQ